MADNSERIRQIRDLLASGVTSVTTDGQTTSFDHDSLRTELRQLIAEDDSEQGRRPIASSIYLGGF
jgi:hypothetical protein